MATPYSEANTRRGSAIQEDKSSQNGSDPQKDAMDVELAQDNEKATTDVQDVGAHNGEHKDKFKQLSWLRLTSVLIVEAIALGS